MTIITRALPEKQRRASQRIKAIRAGLGMTQMEFAYELHVTVSCVSNWERGVYVPSGLAERSIRELCIAYSYDLNSMRRFTA